ncbi:helix-turn-helix domain-containing protein [Gulosibacter sediminis]|uniref:helix-turn-helix domain-containing protein n=1 Tax=Gulosibacter sediminis TaxID=1729695 RepID=UPI0024A980EE|nr:helix-turn-helix domain-containing protein [Gulosibacter sediminis]
MMQAIPEQPEPSLTPVAQAEFPELAEAAGIATIDYANWPQAGDRRRWRELLGRVEAEHLAERYLVAVREVPEYRDPRIPLSEIRRIAYLSFDALLATLTAGDASQLIAIADEVGATRARAQIPMASLMTAIRLDFALIWNEIVTVSASEDADLLLRHSMLVWRVVDTYARATQESYLDEVRRQSDLAALARRALITELFQSPPPPPERCASIATELGIPPEATLTVAVATGGSVSALSTAVTHLERIGLEVFTNFSGPSLLAFFSQRGVPTKVVQDALAELREVELGLIAEVDGFAGLHDAAELASALGGLAEPGTGRALTPARDWAKLLRRHLEERRLSIADDIAAALAGCGVAERGNLESAVRAYLRCGNVAEAATETFCHRNTLTNRLNRFHELTGVDVTVPEQAARVVLSWA